MGRFWPYRSGAMQDPANELPRITFPEGGCIRARKEGRGMEALAPNTLFAVPLYAASVIN